MVGSVYAHICKIDGKAYIGQTFYLKSRWLPRSYKSCPRFHRAIEKHGWHNFDHIILLQKDMTKEEMDAHEQVWIGALHTTDSRYGYNIAIGGGGSFGYTRPPISEETREKMAAASRGKKHSPETKVKMSLAGKGKTKPPEHREKLSAAKLGKKTGPFTAEHIHNMNLAKLGKKHSPERVENMRRALLSLRKEVPAVFRKGKGTSQYKGVMKRKNRWRARIRLEGKDINLGQFGTEVEAAKAYDTAARQHLGQFALLNFPQENERGALRGGA